MQSSERLDEIFKAVLDLPGTSDVTRLRQINAPGWDSLAHVSLVAAIESEFGLQIDAADSLELTSYEAVRLYLEERGL